LRNVMIPGLAVFLMAPVACREAQKNPPLIVCQAGEKGCPHEKPENRAKLAKTGSPDGPSGAPSEPHAPSPPAPETKKPEEPSHDEGGDFGGGNDEIEPAGVLSCTVLASCCRALRDAAMISSADQCDQIVLNQNAASCEVNREEYRKGDGFYEPPPGCE
jgi:hypothetical protein